MHMNSSISNRSISTASSFAAPTSDPTRTIIYQVFSCIIDVLVILGNSFVIWIVIRKKNLHTVTNMLLISLAISDLLVGLALIPSFVTCIHVTCDLRFAKMTYDYFLFVSVANLCAITIDRYTAVMHPLRYPNKMTFMNAMRAIALAWIVPLVLSIPPAIWTYSNISLEHQELANKIFYTIQVIFFVFIPCCLMLWAYSKIFHQAMKQARRIHAETGCVLENANGGRSFSSTEARNAFKVFGSIVAIFVLCWSLSAYRTFVIYYKLGATHPNLIMVSRLLLIFNSALNPLFYTLWKRDVRKEVERLCIGRRNTVHPATSASNPSAMISRQAETIGN